MFWGKEYFDQKSVIELPFGGDSEEKNLLNLLLLVLSKL